MKRKWNMVFISIFSMLLLSGCWSSKEINDLMIVTGMGIDKVKESGKYQVTVQVINPAEMASQSKTERLEVTTYQTTGKTVYEALKRLTVEVPRKLYMSHVQLIVIGEELAREGILKPLDFISRNYEFRADFFILVAKKNKAENVMQILTPTEPNPSVSLYSSLELSEKEWAPSKGIRLDELITAITVEGKDPILTGVKVSGDAKKGSNLSGIEQIQPAAVLKLAGIAAFKGDKLVGWLNEKESKGFNYIAGNVKSTVGTFRCEDGEKAAVEVFNTKTDIKPEMKKGEPHISVNVDIDANIGELQCQMDITKEKSIKQIEKIVSKHVKKLMEASSKRVQQDLQSDVFGFGEAIRREYPKEWKKLKDNWNERFETLSVDYNVQVEIKRLGTISNSYEKEMKME
ncbi:Ger(x)C family spore germination protein [Peribacillus acanthi]|uniref:Ger(x)C family spore germination protein n=1 Tax=Peribacillus acanthi TaxID=2171554 RepID=UPI00130056BD|nr:Ger(x)C family spore germination protein [Peribacillus acanthi]